MWLIVNKFVSAKIVSNPTKTNVYRRFYGIPEMSGAGQIMFVGRAFAFYLEMMLNDGLVPATLSRYPLRTVCSSNRVHEEIERR